MRLYLREAAAQSLSRHLHGDFGESRYITNESTINGPSYVITCVNKISRCEYKLTINAGDSLESIYREGAGTLKGILLPAFYLRA